MSKPTRTSRRRADAYEPSARAAAIGMMISQLMDERGWKGGDLVRHLNWSHTKVSHFRIGHRTPKVVDVAMVVAALGMNTNESRWLLEVAEDLDRSNTWLPAATSHDGMARFFTTLERLAIHLNSCACHEFPPQLRSPETVRFLVDNAGFSRGDLHAKFFIGEDAFTTEDPRPWMTAQHLHDLIRFSVLPNVQIRLVPNAVVHAIDSPSFTHMIFLKHRELVRIDAMQTVALLEQDAAVRHARTIIDTLREHALSTKDTRAKLAALATSVADSLSPLPADV